MNQIENKIVVGAPRSRARYENAHRICADCLEHSKQVIPEMDKPYRALRVGATDFASYNGQCYVCEKQAHVVVVEFNTNPVFVGRITPMEHEKNEWSRMAQDAYSRGLNDIGHKFSMAATLRKGEACQTAWFDALQAEYRAWLVDGFKALSV